MLRVPDLKPGETPFDPDFEQSMAPWKTKTGETFSNHSLPISAIHWGNENGRKTTAHAQTPEQRIEALLNLAVVKEMTTALHREEDAQIQELEKYASSKICDIAADHEKFLHGKMADAENSCKNGEQKALLRTMTRAFLAQSRERARALRQRKTAEYYREAVEAQNGEFLVRALRPENVGNDDALELYRKLIFFNMETMLSDFPEKEKREKLAAAAAAFYGKVLEKRLEIDPAGALVMAGTGGVKRALGESGCAAFAGRAARVLRLREIAAVAGAWNAGGKTPEEAGQLAETRYADEGERAYALGRYDCVRFEENRGRVMRTVAALADAWEYLKENDFAEGALLSSGAQADPALAECLREALRLRGDAGGGEGATDYAGFMGFLVSFERDGVRGVMERLRGEGNVYALFLACGGADAGHWLLCLRLLDGAADGADKEYVAALRVAWEGRESVTPHSQEFMECFVAELKCFEKKTPLIVHEYVQRLSQSVFLGLN